MPMFVELKAIIHANHLMNTDWPPTLKPSQPTWLWVCPHAATIDTRHRHSLLLVRLKADIHFIVRSISDKNRQQHSLVRKFTNSLAVPPKAPKPPVGCGLPKVPLCWARPPNVGEPVCWANAANDALRQTTPLHFV